MDQRSHNYGFLFSIENLLTHKYRTDSKKEGIPSYIHTLVEKYTEEIKGTKHKIKLKNLLMNKKEEPDNYDLYKEFINNWSKPYHIWLWEN